MWPVSDRFLAALAESHTRVSYVDVWRAGQLVYPDLPVTGGQVDIDESSQVRRSLTLPVPSIDYDGASLEPRDVGDLLAPFGTELAVRSGVRFPEGDEETVPLGVFRIEDAGRGGVLAGVDIKASDRSKSVADARFLQPWNTPRGRRIADEIQLMLFAVDPSWEFYDLVGAAHTTTAAVWLRERWEAVDALARSMGAEVLFDQQGRALLRDIPAQPGAPVWTVDATSENSVLLDVATGLSRAGVFNGVVASGIGDENTPAVYGIALQRTGPFRWGGPFGKIPRYLTSMHLRTRQQAQQAAAAQLARELAFARRVGPTVVANPALDAGDPVLVRLPDGSESVQIAAKFSVPLALGEMGLDTRSVSDPELLEDTGAL